MIRALLSNSRGDVSKMFLKSDDGELVNGAYQYCGAISVDFIIHNKDWDAASKLLQAFRRICVAAGILANVQQPPLFSIKYDVYIAVAERAMSDDLLPFPGSISCAPSGEIIFTNPIGGIATSHIVAYGKGVILKTIQIVLLRANHFGSRQGEGKSLKLLQAEHTQGEAHPGADPAILAA